MSVKITTNMTVAKIFEIAPDSVVILENHGLPVTGCDARTERKLADFMKKLSPEEVDQILDHLNKLKQVGQKLQKPRKEDFSLQEISEGNKKYYKLAGLFFTENAYKNLHQLAEKKGLRIHLSTGGCSGFKYDFDYYDEPERGEFIFPLSEKLAIYMDNFTYDRSQEAVIDFTFGLHSSGLQIINPSKKRSCSCGTSIGF